MTTFLRGKLEDVDTVQPALRGLRVLANLETFSDQCAVEMMDSYVCVMSNLNQCSLREADASMTAFLNIYE